MNPRYTFTPAIVLSLMEIEAARQAVQLTVLLPAVVKALSFLGGASAVYRRNNSSYLKQHLS